MEERTPMAPDQPFISSSPPPEKQQPTDPEGDNGEWQLYVDGLAD
ncbi:hypothetical protein COLO4_19846 [Corchorus olitorius]|uniref:Uncharacterized protein n=1 Tax=Corchorus olitorius TaxID=93759 RepID=A0A1R3J328_9ROSI|nr:hypothetical protein COLO4_19846 [Corchorus olitorius]